MRETLHIYSRVSTAIQELGSSLDYQRELGEKCATENGFDFEVHNEGVHSSSSEDPMERDVLRRLLARIENGEIKHLFVYNQDRLSRNEIAWTTIKVLLMRKKVILYTPNGIINFDNAMDRLLFGVITEITAYENTLRSERTRQGKLRALREGKIWKGGPPNFGYSIQEKQLVPNEEEVVWLEKMYEMYASGLPCSQIGMELVKNKVKTRRGNTLWNDRSVDVILGAENNCDIYTGSYTYNDKKSGEIIICKSPQILPMKLIERVRKERIKRESMRVKREVDTNFYLLRELLICGECGSKLWGRINHKLKREFYFCKSTHENYRNKNIKKKIACQLGNMPLKQTDDIIWNTVLDVMEQSNLFKDEVKKQITSDTSSMNEQKLQIENLRKSIGRNKSKLSKERQLVSLLNEDEEDNHRETIEQVELKIHTIEVRISEDERMVRDLDEKVRWVDWVGQFASKIDSLRDLVEPKERREFLDGILSKVSVNRVDIHKRKINLEFKYPYVNDSLEWKNKEDKSTGYILHDGKSNLTINADLIKSIGKKTEIKIVSKDTDGKKV
jgi:site-specific DNA recombinase